MSFFVMSQTQDLAPRAMVSMMILKLSMLPSNLEIDADWNVVTRSLKELLSTFHYVTCNITWLIFSTTDHQVARDIQSLPPYYSVSFGILN